ncbi:jumonji domain-containing protein 6, partial [Lobosporangium transversale]
EFEELIQVNPDLYAEYVKNEMRPPSKPKPIISSVLEFFQETTGYPQESEKYSGQDQISPALEAFIKKLYSSAILPDEETSIDPHRPPPLRLGEGFVHYKADHLSNYLGNYGRVLSYGCEVLGIDPNVLQQEISAVEDLLFKNQPKQIRHQFAQHDFTIPDSYDTLERIDYDKVSREEFIELYEEKYKPVVIRGVMEDWDACKNWNKETFLRKYYSQPFKVGEDDDGNNVYVKMKYFLKYAETDGLKDDSPLYIFDSGFVKRKLTPVQKRRISGSASSSSSSSSGRRRKKTATKPSPSSPSLMSKGGNDGSDGGVATADFSSSANEWMTNGVTPGSKRARSRSNSPSSGSNKIIRVFGKRNNENGSSNSYNSDSRIGTPMPLSTGGRPSKREEEHASTLLNDFMVPKYFKDDLF